jgi:hypothetical protein
MSRSVSKLQPQNSEIESLEKEIAALEAELSRVEFTINTFESHLRAKLQIQILRIRELTELYKKKKSSKKAKRLEQKKKGKNYKEPQGLKKVSVAKTSKGKLSTSDQQELKRLYKEAIVQVHPDKFVNAEEEKSTKATELTSQLNALYERGDLDELSDFHEHIISGNAMSHIPFQASSIVDGEAMVVFLQKKKEELRQSLQEIKTSRLYEVVNTYSEPDAFVDELRSQFDERIKVLEKRTRKK